MTTIYLCPDAAVVDYTATVKGPKAVVTVKIAVTESYALAGLLKDLESAKHQAAEKRNAETAAKAAQRKRAPERVAIEHEPTRLLPYFGGRP